VLPLRSQVDRAIRTEAALLCGLQITLLGHRASQEEGAQKG
jgi:hypothetical protein